MATVFLDIEKAFNKVWIFSLIYKLIVIYHSSPLIKLIFNYLKDRNFLIKIKDSVSQQFFAHFGILQGTKLSPKLLNIFINDIPYYLQTHLAIFADNVCNRHYAILAITKHLRLLSTWFAKRRVAVNVNKTESILSCLRQESRDKYKIELVWLL